MDLHVLRNILSLYIASLIFCILVFVLFSPAKADAIEARLHFNVAAVGDWGCTKDANNTVQNIISKQPEVVLGLGDYSYDEKDANCWIYNVIKPLKNITKITLGNHDVDTLYKLNQFRIQFDLTTPYYSFNYENIHFLSMASEFSLESGSEQYFFVEKDLKKAASNPNIHWIIVYYHKPAYGSPSLHELYDVLRDNYHPLFQKYNVDLVLQGHDHNYDRTYPIKYNSENSSEPIISDQNTNSYFDPQGQIFATVGTGGVNLYPFEGKARYVPYQYVGYGFLDIDIINNGNTLSAKFYANDGTIKDRFTITKAEQ